MARILALSFSPDLVICVRLWSTVLMPIRSLNASTTVTGFHNVIRCTRKDYDRIVFHDLVSMKG